jgi:aminoglycoside phosphotransferase (APT) family kinase protein
LLAVESISKTRVERSVAEHIVADAFGSAVRLTRFDEFTDGWFNAVHDIELDDGRRCVLKVAPPPDVAVLTYERDILRAEVEAIALVRERTTLPAPAVLWFDASHRRVPSDLFVMEHLPGTSLASLRSTLDADQQAAVEAQLAGMLRELHAIEGTWFGYAAPGSVHVPTWSAGFVAMLDGVLDDGEHRDVNLPAPYDELRTMARRRSDALDEVRVPRLVHWDLWDANVFVHPDSLQVTGVIDFERVLWGDPLMEAQFRAKATDPAFIEAYGSPVITTDGSRERRLLYDTYLYLIMVIESEYRQYPTDDLEQWARAQLVTVLHTLLPE